jgi:hypothetical protein
LVQTPPTLSKNTQVDVQNGGEGIVVASKAVGATNARLSVSPANAALIKKDVSRAIAKALGNVFASTLIDRTWPVANVASVEVSHARIDVITDPITVLVLCTSTPANPYYIQLKTIAIAPTEVLWKFTRPIVLKRGHIKIAGIRIGTSKTNKKATAIIQGCIGGIIARDFQSATKCFSVIANSVAIFVKITRATAHAEGVNLVAIAVAITFWNVGTTAVVNRSRTIADVAFVNGANTLVHIVTDGVHVNVVVTYAAAIANGIEIQT